LRTERPPLKVEVAVVVAKNWVAVTAPVKTADPFTPRVVPGVVEPIPTLPPLFMRKKVVVA